MARRLGAAVATAAGAVSYYYRPLYDETSDGGCSREKHTFTSTSELCDRANQIPEMQMGSCPAPSLLYRLAQHVVVFSCTTTSRIFLYFGGQFRVKEDEHYAHFVATVRRRDPGVPLITVSNHRSMLDDPFLMASVLPLQMSYQHRYLRWGICSQEFCFNPKLASIIGVYSGLGKVMPIWRGGGINQKLLLNFARRSAVGDWIHVFPEGGIWQRTTLGGRDNKGREHEIGRLKWGVGKLIAHSPRRPVVIPFFHWGMETILPQHPQTKALLTKGVPVPGHNVTVRFGSELHFDDLIQAHERKFGPLWKYNASVDDDDHSSDAAADNDFHNHWDSKPEEKELYALITRRIETALHQLNTVSNEELFDVADLDKG